MGTSAIRAFFVLAHSRFCLFFFLSLSKTSNRVLALTDITGITVSKFNDNVMVVHAKEVGHDYVISVGGETGNFGWFLMVSFVLLACV